MRQLSYDDIVLITWLTIIIIAFAVTLYASDFLLPKSLIEKRKISKIKKNGGFYGHKSNENYKR